MPIKEKWDLVWRERPPEEARNLNPAFCGEMIYRAAGEYNRLREQTFSLGLTTLVLPLILHKPTRERLPKKASSTFVGWAAENGIVLAQLPDRTTHLLPVTREALLFLLQHRAMRLEGSGMVVGEKPIRGSAASLAVTDDTADVRRSARLVGRWFANQGEAASIMQVLGVMP